MGAHAGQTMQFAGAYLNWHNQREAAKAEGRQMLEQAHNAIRTMNYAFMNYEQERRDSFESALEQLEKSRIMSSQLQGSILAATNEEMSDSRTGKLLARAQKAQGMRTEGAIKSNYSRKSNEIDLNKEQQLIYTKSYIAGLKPPKMPSTWALVWDMVNVGLKAHNQQANADAYRMARTGYDTSGSGGIDGNRHKFQWEQPMTYSYRPTMYDMQGIPSNHWGSTLSNTQNAHAVNYQNWNNDNVLFSKR